MTDRQIAERMARSVRYGEQVRAEERKRAWDIIELATLDAPDDVALVLWQVAEQIVKSKS